MRVVFSLILLISFISSIRGQTATQGQDVTRGSVTTLLDTKNPAESQKWLDAHNASVSTSLWDGLTEKGIEYFNSSQNDHALRAHEIALQVATTLHDDVRIGESKHQIGRVYKSLGKLTEALNIYMDAQQKLSQAGPDAQGYLAYLLKDVAIVYRDQGDFENGRRFAQQSLELAKSLDDRLAIGLAYLVLGTLHKSSGDYTAAATNLEVSRPYFVELNSEKYLADVAINLGDIYALRGDYAQSFLQYRQAEQLIRKLNQPLRLARLYRNVAFLYGSQGENDKMSELLGKSLKLAREIRDSHLVTDNLLDLGMVASVERDTKTAERHLAEGLKLAEQSHNLSQISTALMGLGIVSTETENYEVARRYFEQALEKASQQGDKQKIANIHWALSKLYVKKGDPARAIPLAEKVVAWGAELNIPDSQSFALTVKGEAYLQQRQFALARKALLEAIDLIEAGRAKVTGDASAGATFLEERVTAYQLLVSLGIAEGKTAEALLAAERAKGRSLLDVLTRGRKDVHQLMSAEERSESERLNAEVARLNAQLFAAEQSEEDGQKIVELKNKLTEARLKYDNFQNSIRAREQRVMNAAIGEASIIGFDQIGELIRSDEEAILVYATTPQTLHLFVLTRTTGGSAKGRGQTDHAFDLQSYSIPISINRLTELTTNFRKRLGQRKIDFRGEARALYDLLVKPAAAQLADKSLVCIVPDGPLWDLPFQALVEEKNNYLLERTAIYFAPSLSVLSQIRQRDQMKKRNETQRKALLAIGNPAPNSISTAAKAGVTTAKTSSASSNRATITGDSNERQSMRALGALPAAEAEVRAIGKFYPADRSRVITGADATETIVKRDGGEYSVLHLATHGILNDRQPLYSYLTMSRAAGEDGLLEAWEIMNLNLSADLVVLSACDTARGKSTSGEGVVGMSWAFFAAGVPATVVSQWEVDSTSTSQLMIEFHRQLTQPDSQKGEVPNKAEALRNAAMKLLRQSKYEEPYFWAGFVVIGVGS